METATLIAVIALAGTIISASFTFRSANRATDVAWAKEIRQDAADARKEVETLRIEVRELRRQLAVVTNEADYWIGQHQTLRRHAFRSGMTLERLRELFGPEPTSAQR